MTPFVSLEERDAARLAQHQQRLAWMPWLYYRLKPKHRAWADAWQADIQARLMALETITIGTNSFIAPDAALLAEPGRPIVIGDSSFIGAQVFAHGPITIGNDVGINHGSSLDGGAAGIRIGNGCRIASGVAIYAFNHGLSASRAIRDNPVTSLGVTIGCDVWIGARVCIRDGVTIGDHAVVGIGSVVTRDVAPWTIVAGNPAQPIGDRRTRT